MIPEILELLRRVHVILEAQGVSAYLVGGWLRDQLMGRLPASFNVDLTVPRGALALADLLAEQLHGAYVPLDEAAGSARVVVTPATHRVELDLSDFRGETLAADLARRDFTINALALPLGEWLSHPQELRGLIDPLHGQDALRQRRLIPCFPGTFLEDPVRILRAFRFVSQLDMTLDPATLPLMKLAATSLARVAGERVRDELVAVCDTDRAAPALQALDAIGALEVLFPELSPGRGMQQGGVHHLDVFAHQVETVAQADRFLADFTEFSPTLREALARYSAEQLVERRSRKALMKLAGLLHDVGKPARRTVEADGEIWFYGHEQTGAELAEQIVARLRLSNREGQMVCRIIRHHLRPGFLSREPQLTPRAIYRFFKELAEDGPGCLLVWWADRMAARGVLSRLDQLDQQRGRLEELLHAYFFKAEEVVKPVRLVNGRQLMAALHLESGSLIGELLGAIEEAQAEGRVRSSDEALALARALLDQQRTADAP